MEPNVMSEMLDAVSEVASEVVSDVVSHIHSSLNHTNGVNVKRAHASPQPQKVLFHRKFRPGRQLWRLKRALVEKTQGCLQIKFTDI